MDVYRSETGQWNENLLSGSEEDSFLTVVAYNAKLYWYNSNYVEVYGHFNDCPAIAIFIHGSETALARTLSDY
ncbi:hypothetical protein NC652_011706 [Populus alba x Populus x berolinensis]|nr:hypothetical protein NC652_011706 [Populus alba x Populus x berolinensis]